MGRKNRAAAAAAGGQPREIKFGVGLSWALGMSTGRQFITALVATYILIFLTDVYGVPAGAAGIIMTCATVWDAINDPIIGSLADKTRTRWGTYRPYMLFVPLPLAIVSCLLFAAPELSTTGKIVYVAVLYICYGMLVTTIEIPYNAILPTMSKNAMEKNDILVLSTFIASITILIVSSFTTNLVAVLGGDDPAKGYLILVTIGAVIMCVTSWIAFAACKEKYTVQKENAGEKVKVKENLATVFRIKQIYPMLGFWCVGCILYQIIMASSVYYCTYYLMNPALITTYMLVISISGMVGVMGLMPPILRIVKGSMKKAVTYTQSVCVVCYLILFFVGGKSIPALYILTFIASMFATMTNAFRNMTVVGMVDYTTIKTGKQCNGLITAMGGFAYKCGAAISNAILAGVLAVTGYIANAIGGQPDAAMVGINSVRFLVPMIATIIYIILVQFYPEKQLAKLQAERNEKAAAEAEASVEDQAEK